MNTVVLNPGILMVLGGKNYVLPPIALGPLRALQDRLKVLSDTTDPLSPEAVDTVIDAALASLKRNYPEMTREEVGNLIDLGNMGEVLRAVMDVSGMLRKELQSGKPDAGMPQTTGTVSSAT